MLWATREGGAKEKSCIWCKVLLDTNSFPLNKIKRLLSQKEQGKNIYPLIELSEAIFGKGDGTTLNEAEFCQATGLDREQVRKRMEGDFLLPLEVGIFNGYDVAVGKIYAGGIAIGAELSDMAFYVDAAKQIVDGEMRLRQKLTAHLPEEQDAETTKRLVEAARAVRNYVIDRVFQRRVASANDLKDGRLTS
jgi:hypothetical protein